MFDVVSGSKGNCMLYTSLCACVHVCVRTCVDSSTSLTRLVVHSRDHKGIGVAPMGIISSKNQLQFFQKTVLVSFLAYRSMYYAFYVSSFVFHLSLLTTKGMVVAYASFNRVALLLAF